MFTIISILLATFNGEKYLAEQLDSLFAQTFTDFMLYIQDDASTDSTMEILTKYQNKYPEKIVLSRLEKNTGNAKHNFLKLMSLIEDDYVMLCDQDDVWLPDKIQVTLAKMKAMEEKHKGHPILVFTDLTVVNKDLAVINPSYKTFMMSDYFHTAFNQVLIQNVLTGCTAMYNRQLAMLLTNIPKYCVMHDWWLQLVASAFAKIGFLDRPTILYRQHGKNSVGAKDVRKFAYKIDRLINGNKVRQAIYETYLQAESFCEIYEDILSYSQKNILKQYCAIPRMNKVMRWRTICKLKTFKIGISRNIAYFIFI